MNIITKNLSKRFNREWIFKNLNFEFSSPGIYAITGPNGSGKSTLLQVLWGQMIPSSGSIQYFYNQKEVPQSDVFKLLTISTPYMELIEEFTLHEMVKFHFSFKPIRNKFSLDEIIEAIGLAHAKDKFISNFSSGMRQRLKLGLAFFSDCEILFLDEPTTNLDKKAIEWYQKNLELVPPETMVLIASNQEHEYPETAIKLDITDYKKGY